MATIKGVWVWDNNLYNMASFDSDKTYSANFTSNGVEYSSMRAVGYEDMMREVTRLYYDNTVVYEAGWTDSAYQTIDFGETDQTIDDELFAWLSNYATQQPEQSGGVL